MKEEDKRKSEDSLEESLETMNGTLASLEEQIDELFADDSHLLAVPNDTKYVLTIGFNEKTDQYSLGLVDLTGNLTYEEGCATIDEAIEDIANLVDVIEYNIEEKTRIKTKEELKRGFKVMKGDK